MAKTPSYLVVGDYPEVLKRHLTGNLVNFVVATVMELEQGNRFHAFIDKVPGKPTYIFETTEAEMPRLHVRIILSGNEERGYPNATYIGVADSD